MASADLFYEKALEDGSVTVMARVSGEDGAYITQASISAITCEIFDTTAPTTRVANPSVVVSSSVFDALQTDARWSVDSTGYNFRHEIPADTLTTPNRRYRVQYIFTPTAGSSSKFPLAGEISTVDMFEAA